MAWFFKEDAVNGGISSNQQLRELLLKSAEMDRTIKSKEYHYDSFSFHVLKVESKV